MILLLWRPSRSIIAFSEVASGMLEKRSIKRMGRIFKDTNCLMYSTAICAFENITSEWMSKSLLALTHCAEFFWTAGRSDTMGTAMKWAFLEILTRFCSLRWDINLSRKAKPCVVEKCLKRKKSKEGGQLLLSVYFSLFIFLLLI